MRAVTIFPDELRGNIADYFVRIIKDARTRNGSTVGTCPKCGGIGHLSLFDKGGRMVAHCYKCGLTVDIYGLCAVAEGVSVVEAARKVKRYYGWGGLPAVWDAVPLASPTPTKNAPEPHTDFSDYIRRCVVALPDSEGEAYLRGRGLTVETMRRFNLGYDRSHHAVTLPYNRTGSYFVRRSIREKAFYKPPFDKAGREPVFNGSAIRNSRRFVCVCESQLDAISLAQCGADAIAIGGAGNAGKLVKLIQDSGLTELCIGLCFDNDDAGDTATENTKESINALGNDGIIAEDFRFMFDGFKDVNARLEADSAGLERAVREQIQAVADYWQAIDAEKETCKHND